MGNTISTMFGGNAAPPMQEPRVDDGWSKSKRKRKRRQERKQPTKQATLAADESTDITMENTTSNLVVGNINPSMQEPQVDAGWSKSKRKRKRQQERKRVKEQVAQRRSSIDPPPDSKPFPFFQLPRELRDEIYGHLAQERYIKDHGSAFPCFPKGVFQVGSAPMSFGLVSKQFKKEYEEELARQPGYRTLRLHAVAGNGNWEGKWRWSKCWLSYQTHLRHELSRVSRLHIVFDDDSVGLFMNLAKKELQVLLSCMPLVKTIEIEFCNVVTRNIHKYNDFNWVTGCLLACVKQLQSMLRDDSGKLIGDFTVEYSAVLEGQMPHTTCPMLRESWPEFDSWVPKRQNRALVVAYLSSVHISCRTRIFEDHGLDPHDAHLRMIARLGDFMEDAMARIRELQYSKTWRADFRKMWKEVIEQRLDDQRFRIWSSEL